jgi:hypothetical protein
VADADKPRLERWLRKLLQERASQRAAWAGSAHAVHAESQRHEKERGFRSHECPERFGGSSQDMADPNRIAQEWPAEPRLQCDPWFIEPAVGRVVNGLPCRVERLKCLGNSIVPQIAQIIGTAIIKFEETPYGPNQTSQVTADGLHP